MIEHFFCINHQNNLINLKIFTLKIATFSDDESWVDDPFLGPGVNFVLNLLVVLSFLPYVVGVLWFFLILLVALIFVLNLDECTFFLLNICYAFICTQFIGCTFICTHFWGVDIHLYSIFWVYSHLYSMYNEYSKCALYSLFVITFSHVFWVSYQKAIFWLITFPTLNSYHCQN